MQHLRTFKVANFPRLITFSMLTAIMENRHIQRVIGSSSYRENYIWFNALILICCIRKYKAPFRLSADCSSLRGFTENNLIEMLESCFHEIWDAPVKHKEDQGRKKDRATSDGGVTSQRGSRGYEKKERSQRRPKARHNLLTSNRSSTWACSPLWLVA